MKKLQVNTVYALFYKEDPRGTENMENAEKPKTYRMIGVDETGLFGTVIPEECSYVTFEMRVTDENGESKGIEAQIVYNLRQAVDPNDPYHEIEEEPVTDAAGEVKQRGSGSFEFTQKTRDCFYWDMSYHNSRLYHYQHRLPSHPRCYYLTTDDRPSKMYDTTCPSKNNLLFSV